MLAHYSHGQGKTIILLHGFCENSTCFHKQVLLLKDRYNLLCIDLPGFGQSDVVEGLTMEQMADAVEEVLQYLHLDKVVMLGHSMGGYATLAYAKKYSSRLAGFGLLHSTALADTDERKQKREQAMAFIDKTGGERYVREFIPPLFKDALANKADVTYAIDEALSISDRGLIHALDAMKNRPDSTSVLKETKLPVLFVAGKYDALIPAEAMAEQAGYCSRSVFHLLPDSAHMGMVEEPDAMAETIDSFAGYCFK